MQTFQPYIIQHLQFSQLGAFSPPHQNAFIVIWWRKIPLGHLWLEDNKKNVSALAFKEMALKAVQPALDYYLSKDTENKDWLQNIQNGNIEAIEQLLINCSSLNFNINSLTKCDEKLSLIICTRNRPLALQQCLHSLMKSTDTSLELIVVDNASDDKKTEEVAKSYPLVHYIREEKIGLDIARNTGVLNASHDIIAYIDDDVIVDEDWVKNLKTCFKDPKTMAVSGLILPVELQTESQYIFEKYWGFNKGYIPRLFNSKYFKEHLHHGVPAWRVGVGANMAFRKEIFGLIGLFDERLDAGAAGCNGDSEFLYRILAEGWNCRYFPSVIVYHQHRKSKEELHKQIFYYMRGHASSLLIQYEKYRHKGNLKRLYRDIPKYFITRLNRSIFTGSTYDSKTLFTEIKGCISGLKFYQLNRNEKVHECSVKVQTLQKKPEDSNLVSIVLFSNSQTHHLKPAIESILNQTYQSTQILVVNEDQKKDISYPSSFIIEHLVNAAPISGFALNKYLIS